ncbi:MAG: TonB-dependent receptor [Steroidobacteraceae bacterium]
MSTKASKSLRLASAIRHALIAMPLLAAAGPALAGEVSGRVTDGATGRPLPNATVRIDALGQSVSADRAGEYRIFDVPAGTHEVSVEYVGYDRRAQSVAVGETGTAAADFALGSASLTEITVVGYRLAQATALQDKKSSVAIKDSITADDAGKLPDRNAAETLSRVPGISVTTDQGEGRYVNVRGIDAALSNVTVDGQIIGSPEGDTRRVALDTVPADVLSKLEVIKAVTPDMDGNSIGGTINLVTPSAFDDPDGHFFSANMDAGYYDLNGDNPFGASAAFGQTFGPEKQWGVVLSASYSDRTFSSQNVQGGDPWTEEGDFLVPDEFVLRDYEIQRVRKGFVANLEYRPSDRASLYLRNLYNEYEDTELQSEYVADYRNGDLENQTPTSGTFTEGEAERINSERLEIQSILTSTLGGKFQIGDSWTLGVSATYGEVEQDTPYENIHGFALDSEVPMTYDTSRRFFNVDAGPDVYDPGRFEMDEVAQGGQLIEEDMVVGQVDLTRELQFGENSGSIKFGAKAFEREQTSDQDFDVYDGFDGDYLMSQVALPRGLVFESDAGGYDFGRGVDYRAAQDFFEANQGSFERSDADSIAESFGVDYTVREDVTAGYLMGTATVGRATWIGGVRYERTANDFTAFDVQFVDGDAVSDPPPEIRGNKDYENWMPGLQLNFAMREDLLLRAAWTNTIGRPSYEQTVPFRIFETEEIEDEPGVFEGAIETGNPDLDPLESMNFDVSLEWYLEPAGIVAIGAFYKDIDNPIFTRLQVLEGEEFEGRLYDELEIVQPQNARSGEILGFELNYQQQFVGLPNPFDGFGLQLGYTWTDSEADTFDRDDKVPFFLQSDDVASVSLFWAKYGFEARLGYAYRSEYLDTVGEDPESDLYVDSHGQLDFKASYQATEKVNVFLQMQNLTGEPLRYFSGDRSRMAENEYYSWNATAGMTVKF